MAKSTALYTVYLCGEDALRITNGIKATPLDAGDKVKDLAVVVSAIINKVFPEGIDGLPVSVIASNPFASDLIAGEITTELKRLTKGFEVNGASYSGITFDRIGSLQEGLILLDVEKGYNGLIDLGQGTLLAGIRHPYEGIKWVSLMDGNIGGCNLWLSDVLNDPQFLKDIKNKGFSAPPSPEKLSSLLSSGRWDIRGVDFRAHLKRNSSKVITRLQNAAQTLTTVLQQANPDDELKPSYALIGGGSALLQEVLTDKEQSALVEMGIYPFHVEPDYQTVLTMRKLFFGDLERFKTFDQLAPNAKKKRAKKAKTEVEVPATVKAEAVVGAA